MRKFFFAIWVCIFYVHNYLSKKLNVYCNYNLNFMCFRNGSLQNLMYGPSESASGRSSTLLVCGHTASSQTTRSCHTWQPSHCQCWPSHHPAPGTCMNWWQSAGMRMKFCDQLLEKFICFYREKILAIPQINSLI
jgi:hypothetical protein